MNSLIIKWSLEQLSLHRLEVLEHELVLRVTVIVVVDLDELIIQEFIIRQDGVLREIFLIDYAWALHHLGF